MKLFALAASRNPVASVNRSLIRLVAEAAKTHGGSNVQIDLSLDFSEFDMPWYDDEAYGRAGLPEQAIRFKERIEGANAVIIASPEYNSSMPGFFKNAIDWISTVTPMPWHRKPVLLMSATPSVFGGIKGTAHLRQSLEYMGAYVFPESFQLAQAVTAFDPKSGKLAVQAQQERLDRLVGEFIRYAARF